jgi:hypothetical protein
VIVAGNITILGFHELQNSKHTCFNPDPDYSRTFSFPDISEKVSELFIRIHLQLYLGACEFDLWFFVINEPGFPNLKTSYFVGYINHKDEAKKKEDCPRGMLACNTQASRVADHVEHLP